MERAPRKGWDYLPRGVRLTTPAGPAARRVLAGRSACAPRIAAVDDLGDIRLADRAVMAQEPHHLSVRFGELQQYLRGYRGSMTLVDRNNARPVGIEIVHRD
jgi:hypothetical protein